jgi:hypothetical protein
MGFSDSLMRMALYKSLSGIEYFHKERFETFAWLLLPVLGSTRFGPSEPRMDLKALASWNPWRNCLWSRPRTQLMTNVLLEDTAACRRGVNMERYAALIGTLSAPTSSAPGEPDTIFVFRPRIVLTHGAGAGEIEACKAVALVRLFALKIFTTLCHAA